MLNDHQTKCVVVLRCKWNVKKKDLGLYFDVYDTE